MQHQPGGVRAKIGRFARDFDKAPPVVQRAGGQIVRVDGESDGGHVIDREAVQQRARKLTGDALPSPRRQHSQGQHPPQRRAQLHRAQRVPTISAAAVTATRNSGPHTS
ncbi:MAG TPA: hypothetical protein PKH77_06380 [Anaerolineae bacterium]|nr:hypothetical protein [Anaerolineae bacterium]